MNAATVVRKLMGAEGSRFGADFVLLDPAGKTLRGLNPTAARVWELIDGKRTVSQIAAGIAEHFNVSAEQATGDVMGFLTSIERAGLIERVGESA